MRRSTATAPTSRPWKPSCAWWSANMGRHAGSGYSIGERFCSRMEEALKRLEKTMATGRLKNRNLMERRLGKIQARHPSVNDLYEISLRETGEGVRLSWHMQGDFIEVGRAHV